MVQPVLISSLDDPRAHVFQLVARPRELAREGLFVIEGRRVLRVALQSTGLEFRSVLLSPAALSASADLIDRLPSGTPVLVAPPSVMSDIVGYNVHRGCLAIAARPAQRPLETLRGRLIVALEAIVNPDNVGGIFRNALAFGAHGLVLDERSADPLYRKCIRVSMGATLRLPWTVTTSLPETLDRLAASGHVCVALTPRADAPAIDEVAARVGNRASVLVFGGEADGLSAAALERATLRARIPMAPGVDSLNVATAAGIALFRFAPLATAPGRTDRSPADAGEPGPVR